MRTETLRSPLVHPYTTRFFQLRQANSLSEEGHTKQEWLEQALDCDMTLDEWETALIQLREFGARVEHVLKRYDLDAVVFPAFSWMSVINAMAGKSYSMRCPSTDGC